MKVSVVEGRPSVKTMNSVSLQEEDPQDNIISHVLNASDTASQLDLANEVTTILFAGL